MTEDRLGVETLARARQQLNEDHYGLEKVKKRLLEYLAVLKLKQSVNDSVNAQIAKAKEEAAVTQAGSPVTSENNGERNEPKLENAKIQILKAKRMVDKSPILLLVGPPGLSQALQALIFVVAN
jgi:ATP-dependent Lon protease